MFGYLCIATDLSHFNQCLTSLLHLRNSLLSVMMQQGCNIALPLVGEEYPYEIQPLQNFINTPLQQNYHFVECRVLIL